MSEENTSYSRIFKGIAVFGGVQFIQILVRIVRGKLASILIGAKGMGLTSIYTSSVSLIVSVAGLGMSSSGVRDISEASTIKDIEERNEKISIINQCFYLTYILGFVLCFALSPLLSYFTFGDFSYTISFALLSFYVLFEICNSHHIVILQGMGLIKKLASATITITISTLVLAVAFYYFFGLDGIIPVMILGSLIGAAIRYNQVRKLHIPFKWHPIKKVLKESKTMISIGSVSLMSLIMNSIMIYLLNIFLSRYGTIEVVGYFNAANSIIIQSVSMIFAAMSADYYPRLAKIAHNREETNLAVNRQTEVLCYIAVPILGIMIVASYLIVYILLSKEFLVITDFMKWVAMATAFQVYSYPLGHVIWAKGDLKVLFYLNGLYMSTSRLVVYVIGYYLGGLEGLGYAMCVINAFNFFLHSLILKKRYGYERDAVAKRNIFYLIPLLAVVFLSIQNNPYLYAFAILIVAAISTDCFIKLNKKLNLIQSIQVRLKKNKQ